MSVLELIVDYPQRGQRSAGGCETLSCLFISIGVVSYSNMLNPHWRGNDNQRLVLCRFQPV